MMANKVGDADRSEIPACPKSIWTRRMLFFERGMMLSVSA